MGTKSLAISQTLYIHPVRERERGHIASKKCKLARVGMVHTMF